MAERCELPLWLSNRQRASYASAIGTAPTERTASASPFQDSGGDVAVSRQTPRRCLPPRSARGNAAVVATVNSKVSTASSKTAKTKGAASAAAATTKPTASAKATTSKAPVCDLCCSTIIKGKEDALFCEGFCQSWYHRYCLGVSASYFRELSSDDSTPFMCLHCQQKSHKDEISTLQSELLALKAEVTDLQAALNKACASPVGAVKDDNNAKTTLAAEVQQLKTAVANLEVRSNGTQVPWNEVVRRGKHRSQNNRQRRQGQQLPPAPPSNTTRILQEPTACGNQRPERHDRDSPREVVSGARRVWGTLRSASQSTVRNTISHLTKLNWVSETACLRIKRKFATHTRKARWWFVLHGEEDNMKLLENAWGMVRLQTGWRLEKCTKPSVVTESPSPSTHDNRSADVVVITEASSSPSTHVNESVTVDVNDNLQTSDGKIPENNRSATQEEPSNRSATSNGLFLGSPSQET